jgi:hypothetical protein
MANRPRLAERNLMLSEVIRSEADIAAWMARPRETTTALVRRFGRTSVEKPFGRMSQEGLDEYVADAGKHDAGCWSRS